MLARQSNRNMPLWTIIENSARFPSHQPTTLLGIMKKLISLFILLSAMCCSAVAHTQSVEEADPGFVLLDVLLYRPLGFVATVIGTGAFIGLSPLTAFASIPEPHDAFLKTSKILILAPAAYTFIRPLGDRDFPYYVPSYKYKPVTTHSNVETYNTTATPSQRPVAPAVPNVQPQQLYPYTGKGL